jgi:hypothetical protein
MMEDFDPQTAEDSGGWLDLPALGCFLLRRRVRYLACWLLALALAAVAAREAWVCWNEGERADGNWGHFTIDFACQWLPGRMIVEGRGRQLYHEGQQRAVVEAAYPEGDGRPPEKMTTAHKSDSETLLGWFIRSKEEGHEHLGGPLYPPVHGMLFAPLGTMPPRNAYRVLQLFILLLTFLCGWLIERLTDGRLWWPLAVSTLILLPGYNGTLNLGQNSMLSLTLLLAGWWQLKEGHPVRGGILWGFLAFKPVWAAAFLLVPLLARRWSFVVAMGLTGAALSLATLPLVGVQCWLDWLVVGRAASIEYARQEPWIILSRDLEGIPRRWLLEFHEAIATDPQPRALLATALGLGLWGLVVGLTAAVAVGRRRRVRALTGPAAAFLLLGGYFACYHFMYYDVLLVALPLAALFAEPRRFWPLRRVRLLHGLESAELLAALEPAPEGKLPVLAPASVLLLAFKPGWLFNLVPVLLLAGVLLSPPICFSFDPTYHFPPMDTFFLLGLWLWCGVLTLRKGDNFLPAADAAGV